MQALSSIHGHKLQCNRGIETGRAGIPRVARRCLVVRRVASTTQVTSADDGSGPSTSEPSGCPVLQALKPLPDPALGRFESFWLQVTGGGNDVLRRVTQGRPVSQGWFLGSAKQLIVSDPEAAKEMVAREVTGEVTIGWPKSTIELLGKHSVTATADPARHRALRRLMQPALGSDAVDAYLPEIGRLAVAMLDGLADACAREVAAQRAMPACKSFTFAVIARVVMGLDLGEGETREMEHRFNIWLKSLFTLWTVDAWPFPYHAAMQARAHMSRVIRDQMARTRAQLDAAAAAAAAAASGSSSGGRSVPAAPDTTLARLLAERDPDSGAALSDDQVVDNVLTLLFAGHDTTSSLLASLLHDCAVHPGVMQRLRREQAEVVARYGEEMTPEAVAAMRYAGAVVAESQRLRPIIGGVMRATTAEQAVAGYSVPANMLVSYSLASMMKEDPRWPKGGSGPLDGAAFNPDRWLTPVAAGGGGSGGEGGPAAAAAPKLPAPQPVFGLGPRTCAGAALASAEARVFLAVLARGYGYTADTNTDFRTFPIPRPRNGLPVFMRRLRG